MNTFLSIDMYFLQLNRFFKEQKKWKSPYIESVSLKLKSYSYWIKQIKFQARIDNENPKKPLYNGNLAFVLINKET